MKTQKMSLDNIQGKLSRAEMKSIMAGGPCANFLETLYHCTWEEFGKQESGDACGYDAGTTEMVVAFTLNGEGIPAYNITNMSCD